MVRSRAGGLLWLVLALAGCARSARPDGRSGGFGEGRASFYGAGLHGRLTASGERFDKHQLTAAHRTLRFGTCVEVENLDNGRSVRVRVNDRGPFVGDRLIDVSEAAARALGMLEKGLAQVRLRPC
jgi:rare lipoprotein A